MARSAKPASRVRIPEGAASFTLHGEPMINRLVATAIVFVHLFRQGNQSSHD